MAASDGPGRNGGSGPGPHREQVPVTVGTFVPPDGPPPDDPAAIRNEIHARIGPDDAVAISYGDDVVYVSLRPGRERIADRMRARFGDQAHIDVGGIPWPLDERVETLDGCADPLPPGDRVDGVTAVVTPVASEVPLGGDITGSVVVANTGGEAVTVQWGGAGIPAYLVRPGTDQPVGAFLGIQTLQIVHAPVASGTVAEPLPIVVGITSCFPQAGTAVQPGRYDLVAVVSLDDGRLVRSEPTEITVLSA